MTTVVDFAVLAVQDHLRLLPVVLFFLLQVILNYLQVHLVLDQLVETYWLMQVVVLIKLAVLLIFKVAKKLLLWIVMFF